MTAVKATELIRIVTNKTVECTQKFVCEIKRRRGK